MSTKHTPGPWMKTDGSAIKCDLRPIGLTKDAGLIVASVVGGPTSEYSFPRDESEVEANASLIAAAPELLAALVSMCETMEQQNWGIKSPDQWQTEAYKQARAAIAKATNQSSSADL